MWATNNSAVFALYCDIALLWDTSRVTNMEDVFGYYNPNADGASGAYIGQPISIQPIKRIYSTFTDIDFICFFIIFKDKSTVWVRQHNT